DGLLLSIAHVRFTWFNKCKRFAGLNFKCKLEVELIIKNCQLFLGRGTSNKLPAIETIIKETFNISRTFFLKSDNDIGKNKTMVKFSSIISMLI
ncbi:MAG: hypothetical protein ACK5RG_19605, partial [Cyclobacteriaceae bacterium]